MQPDSIQFPDGDNTSHCRYCGSITKGVELKFIGSRVYLPAPKVCSADACVAKDKEEFEQLELEDYLKKNPPVEYPVLFAGTDPKLLPTELANLCWNWKPNGKGLLIHGTTRKGKSRTAWFIAHRLYGENPKKNRFLCLTMFELESALVASWGTSSWDKTMNHMVNMPLLFLDDLGKEKMTDRMASCLFALIDQRTMHKKPTIITTNLTGETLLERFHDKEVGAAFVARLKDNDLFDRVAVKS